MFAIINVLGDQIKVLENNKYYVPRLKEKVDSEVTFNSVLMVGDAKKLKIGYTRSKRSQSNCKSS